ncbi:DUF3592 domain-containing protein [bacterium]|nr:DUF3592 domain-containing protein [bacterium]
MPKLGTILVATLFIGVGVVGVGYGISEVANASASNDWPTVDGKVVECTLDEFVRETRTNWECKVRYTYEVGGKQYQGDRIAFGYQSTNGKEMHAAIEDKLSQANQVEVHYDPDNPSRSSLSVGIHKATWVPLLGGLMWLSICIAGCGLYFCMSPGEKLSDRIGKWNDRKLGEDR